MDAWVKRLAIAVMALPGCALAQREMQPGNWHITTHATTNGKAEPVQVQDECLGDELKDLAAYFAPGLEGVNAKCGRTPRKAAANAIAYKMKCTGKGFTLEADTEVVVVDAKKFTASMKMDTKTPKERAVVVASIEGNHTGACKR
jgi:hypothetical protein